MKNFFLFMLFFVFLYVKSFSCTSIIVTKGANKTGAVIISYSCDGEYHPHLRYIPAADYKEGDSIEIKSRSGELVRIPQVEHTYKVIGLMNEYQLAIGETTFDGRKELHNKDGLLHYYRLMILALQRAKTAREAIRVMTDLVEKYGYGSTGESFSIADKNEAWIMEMIGKGPGQKGAIWVAIKVPDGMVCAHANMSRIGEFPLNDPDNCLYSKDVIDFAIKKGYYNPKKDGNFNFSKVYNPPTEEQTKYSLRRIWSIFRRISPSKKFSPDYSSFEKGAKPYPLFVKPDEKLTVRDVIALHRDHYEGTEFDMTKNLTGGPFGAPDRARPIKWEVDGKVYSWERPIATQQAAFVFVSESRDYIPDEIGGVFWYGVDNPYTNFFVPLYTSINEIPESYTIGTLKQYSDKSAWWVVNFVANYANIRWSYMIKDIQKVQQEIENLEFQLQPAIEKTAKYLLKQNQKDLVSKFLTKYCVDNAEMNVQKWKKLANLLITKYNDGYIQEKPGRPKSVGYPEEWLKKEILQNPGKFNLKQERDGKGEL